MGYISDWEDASRHARRMAELYPNCTRRRGCPSEVHPIDCTQYRLNHYRRMVGRKLRSLVDQREGT
jgi:hypothetical protein